MDDDKAQKDVVTEPEKQAAGPRKVSRRRFTGVGVGSPLLLSLASRPVWARNCSESGVLSGNLSEANDPACGGEGCSPGYWKNHTSRWHHNYPPHASFNAVFGVDAFPNSTLLDVIRAQNKKGVPVNVPYGCESVDGCENMINALGRHASAALQNAATPISFDLNVPEVIASFQMAYGSGNLQQMEVTKDSLDTLNNQFCPL